MATRLSAVLAGALLLALCPSTRAAAVSPDHPDLRYVGRWDDSTPSLPWAQAKGSTLELGFSGTSLSATLTVVPGEHFRVIVDGDGASSTKVTFVSGVPRVLTTGLAAGSHTATLIKETDQGRATLQGLELDDGASPLPLPPGPSRHLVFYGDSNLAGYSLESEKNLGGSHLVGTHHGFAGITARMFDASYQNVSRSGATIQSLNTSYDRIDWQTSTPLWDFTGDPTDVVIANIGANNTFSPEGLNKTRYKTLLGDLRSSHPTAHIVLFNGFGWDEDEPADYIGDVIAEHGDPNTSWAVFPWVFEQYHGCETDHAGMAQVLAAHLETVTGWTAGEQDVVSGYGQDGDVANGSFERVAPFGGWGWRYFDAVGASRVLDPAGAFHGEHFLRLADGASAHQTNPAGNGQSVTATMWMRAASAGDTVDVSLGFRDQNGGGEFHAPLAESTQTLALSTSWERYTVTTTAPANPPKPVFSVRLTFVAGAGDTVDIDRVATGPWSDVGGGTEGLEGQPTLDGEGPLEAGTAAAIHLTRAPANALLLFWISFASTPLMALGGTVHTIPFDSEVIVAADGSGQFSAATTWPAGVPAGTDVWFQFLVQDGSTGPGITLSNGLLATTP
jgi:hypothetical protein